MYLRKKIWKVLLGFTFSFFTNFASAQPVWQKLDKVAGIYKELNAQNTKADDLGRNLAIAKAKNEEAASILEDIANTGSPGEKDVAYWYATLLKYELGMAYSHKKEDEMAYAICKDAHTAFTKIASKGTPIKYGDGTTDHIFSINELSRLKTETANNLAAISLQLKHYDESANWSQEVLADPNITAYRRFQTTTRLWYIRREQNKNDAEFVNLTLLALHAWNRIDTADKRMLEVNNNLRGSSFVTTLHYFLLQNIPGVDKAETAHRAAFILDNADLPAEAKFFYEQAVDAAPGQISLLWPALRFAEHRNFPDLASKVTALIEPAYSNEPDKMIRGMGRVLAKVIAASMDRSNHLDPYKNGRFNSKYTDNKSWHSSLKLPGEISTFISENGQTYSWQTVAAESKEYRADEKVTAKYKAIVAELKRNFADYNIEEAPGYERWVTIKLDNETTIGLNVLVTGNNSEALILSVTSVGAN